MGHSARPRLAIIGGGGAMGRLFARLFVGRVRDMVLIDYFGPGSRQSSLPLVLEDIRTGGAVKGLSCEIRGIERDARDCVWTTTDQPGDDRALVVLRETGETPDRGSLGQRAATAALRFAEWPVDGLEQAESVLIAQPEDVANVLPRADVVLFAVRFESARAYRQVVEAYRPWVSPGSLVVDLGSIKTLPMSILEDEFGVDVGLLGAHPLFGPSVSNLAGMIVAAVDPSDGRPPAIWREWFLEQLADLRMIVTPVSAPDHDDAMALVQSLTHFTLLAFAYTFVRLDCDPADLLSLRTPVFEPLLYLAARVANLARINPDTYRLIQTFSTRADARRAFVDSATEILAAIERSASRDGSGVANSSSDDLVEMFRRYGEPWSPDGKDRRDRPRREHYLEMGASLVDHLNQLRQQIVASVGQVRGVEERRTGQPPRTVVGVVDLDLLDPGKQDVATRVRLRRLNLGLGRVRGGLSVDAEPGGDPGQDEVIPLARARLLGDDELLAWLFRTNQLVERRATALNVPSWFDRDVLQRLLAGRQAADDDAPIWAVDCQVNRGDNGASAEHVEALVTFSVVIHPGTIVTYRRVAQQAGDAPFRAALADLDARLDRARHRSDEELDDVRRAEARRLKDKLKHERKALVDRRTTEVDREVRRMVRARITSRCDRAVSWLLSHGCQFPRSPAQSIAGPRI